MNKMKRILAVMLAMVMALAMSVTVFATGGDIEPDVPTVASASIQVNGLTKNDKTNLSIYQVVSFNAETNNWEVAPWAADYVTDTTDPYTFDWEGLKGAASNASAVETTTTNETSYTFNNLGIGAYMIIASGETTEYSVMGAATYTYNTDDKLIGPNNVTISAKGQGYTVTKAFSPGQLVTDFAKNGDEISFDITTVFPSFADGSQDREFSITDSPTGMKVTNVEVFVNNIKLNSGTDYTVSELEVADQEVTVTFTPDFIGNANTHAAQDVKVVVTAVVTDENTFKNEATSNTDMSETPATVQGDVGSIKITKTDADQTNVLSGAIFKLQLNGEDLLFVKQSDGVYTLKTDDVEGEGTAEVEATNGTVLLKGLGAGTYTIVEAVAPEGYSIHENIDPVTLTAGEEGTVALKDAEVTVTDTKLSALPSTGGVGITIFTIVGCLIMIAAASMYFMGRRKNEE